MVFVTCARHPSEIIFRERLEHMASRVLGIDLKFVVGGTDLYPPWTGYQGTLNQLLMVPDYLEREVVCCGPEPFMQAMREAVAAEVAFTLSGVQQTCAETGTILATTRAAGRNIPSGCTFGVCGTCKIKNLPGQVHIVHNGGITKEDIAAGYVQACCSHPIGRVELEVSEATSLHQPHVPPGGNAGQRPNGGTKAAR